MDMSISFTNKLALFMLKTAHYLRLATGAVIFNAMKISLIHIVEYA